jgi:nucleotide-binding universal stress UspA family protein
MLTKRILAHLTGLPSDEHVAAVALAAARPFRAHIDFLFLRDLDARLHLFGYEMAALDHGTVVADLQKRMAVREGEARTLAERSTATAQTAECSASFSAVDGTPLDAIGERGALYDLIVAPRPEGEAEVSVREAIEAALFRTGAPLMIAPPAPPAGIGDRILLTWNKSASCRRAIAAALPWLALAKAVTLFHVQTGAKRGPTTAEVATYLAAHGVAATVREVPHAARTVGQAILEGAAAADADLIVLGAYSTSRFREMILGGVTRHIFAHADRPTLMVH